MLAALTWTWTTQAVLPVPPSPPANEGQVTRGHVEFAFSSSTGTHAPETYPIQTPCPDHGSRL